MIRHYYLAMAAIPLLLVGCNNAEQIIEQPDERPVRLISIDLVKTKVQSFPAKSEASKQASLSFRVPGKIAKFDVRAGADVKRGDLLVELVPIDYEIAVAAHQANFQLASVQHQRSEALIGGQLISKDQFDRTYTALKVAENALEQAKTDLSYTKVYAPYDGRIAATYLKAHEYAQALQPVMSIQSDNTIDVAMEVPERLIGAIQRSRFITTPPTASFAVAPEKSYPLQIKEVETAADPSTGTFTVTFTMPKPDDLNIFPNMAATISAELVLGERNLMQKIPQSALMISDGNTYVWRVNANNQVEKVAITLAKNGELIDGLLDGDRIVVAGVDELETGQKVKKWVKERGL